MKKILLFVLVLSLGLCGCSLSNAEVPPDTTVSDDTTEVSVNIDETDDYEPTSFRSPIYSLNELTFDIEDHRVHTDYFIDNDININLGTIHSIDHLKEKVKRYWTESLGTDEAEFEERTLQILYDARSDCWLVILVGPYLSGETIAEGTLGVLSSEPCIIIRRDGKVMASWLR